MELSGKTVLLTGATGGLGRAIAEVLAGRGAQLVLSSRKPDELDRACRVAAGRRATGRSSRTSRSAGAAERLAGEAGHVDVLVANAGLSGGGRLETFSEDDLEAALRVNFEAPVRLARAVLPDMLERNEGHLVFVASLQAKVALARSSVYSGTKFGLRGFALSLRDDLHGTGVGSSVVLPGFIRDAGMFADSGQDAPAGLGTSAPQEVGEGVARSIERDRAEIVVAPLLQRLGAGVGLRLPRLTSRLTRRSSAKAADKVVDGQAAAKR